MQGKGTGWPAPAAWLGGLGAIPFVGLAAALVVPVGVSRELVVPALVGYGAVILSFMGAIHWGLAIAPGTPDGDAGLSSRLVGSVVPPLIGWAALLVPPVLGLLVLAAAFAALLAVDIRATRRGLAPAWYPKLRVPLTLVVVAALLFAAVALRAA